MTEQYDTVPLADPDREADFESLARILNDLSEKGLITHDSGRTYEEQEVRAIEHIATARGMLLSRVLAVDARTFGEEDPRELDRRVVDLLTAALSELVRHE